MSWTHFERPDGELIPIKYYLAFTGWTALRIQANTDADSRRPCRFTHTHTAIGDLL